MPHAWHKSASEIGFLVLQEREGPQVTPLRQPLQCHHRLVYVAALAYTARRTHHQWHHGDPDNSGTPPLVNHLRLFRLCSLRSLRSPWTIHPPTSSPLWDVPPLPLLPVALSHRTSTTNHLRWINRVLLRHIYTNN